MPDEIYQSDGTVFVVGYDTGQILRFAPKYKSREGGSQDMTDVHTASESASAAAREANLAKHVAGEYLAAFYSGDFDRARLLVAEEFSFQGPFLEVKGRDAFFEGARGLLGVVRGHKLIHHWADGGEVGSLYEVRLQTPSSSGSIPMFEWHSVRDGRLVSGHVLFDTARFRELVGPS